MNAIILHGTCDKAEYFDPQYPSLSNSHWFPWLQKQLLINGIFTQTPEMPDAYLPDYAKWKSEFEKNGITSDTILVGYSCGAGFLVRWLSENNMGIEKLVLVAPWMDPNREETTTFFDFTIDSKLTSRVGEMHLFFSEDDTVNGVQESVQMLLQAFPNIQVHKFTDKGHFTVEEMNSVEFPELLETTLS